MIEFVKLFSPLLPLLPLLTKTAKKKKWFSENANNGDNGVMELKNNHYRKKKYTKKREYSVALWATHL